jgi:hypothetical protein
VTAVVGEMENKNAMMSGLIIYLTMSDRKGYFKVGADNTCDVKLTKPAVPRL